VIIDANTVLFPSAAMNAERKEAFRKLIADKLGGFSETDPRWVKTGELSATLQSLPLSYEQGKIRIQLPHIDPRRCSGKGVIREVPIE